MLLYDVRDDDFVASIALPAALGLAVIIGSAVFAFEPLARGLLPPKIADRHERVFARVFLALSTMWTAWVCIGSYVQHQQLADALANGRLSVVTGSVLNLHPMPSGCHGTEGFDVASEHFEYADCVDNGGFNRTGLLREGQRIRVAFRGDAILRLEVLAPN